jgi:excisionase family DNA binding protein
MELPEILTFKQAYQLLNCHPNTLRKWLKKGLIPFFRFGKRGDLRFKREDITNLLKNNTS